MLRFLVESYGIDAQLDVTQEECAELIQAISKYKRSKGNGYLTSKSTEECLSMITEEIAHVMGCLEAIQYLLDIPDEDIQAEIEKADNKALGKRIEKS